jgi:hypothetical protein
MLVVLNQCKKKTRPIQALAPVGIFIEENSWAPAEPKVRTRVGSVRSRTPYHQTDGLFSC